ncbi:MAG: endopeptidase La [Candidatus Hydrogenedentes bacterium]|nr:endopeptidase La [Candidatus Hydrogenedentota bacterium]
MKDKESETHKLPLLPLKDVVVFPRMVVPLLVGRKSSIVAVEECLTGGSPLFLCTQRDPAIDSPGFKDLYSAGVAASILQTLRMPDGTIKVVVEGLGRGRLLRTRNRGDLCEATVERVPESVIEGPHVEALMRTSLGQFETYVKQSGRVAPEVVASLRGITDANALSDLISAYLPLRVEERQGLLDVFDVMERLEKLSSLLMREGEMLEIEQRVRERIREQMDRSQREYYLHEQLKAIHQELGRGEGGGDEPSEVRELIENAKMPEEVREKALRELTRFERMPAMSPEAGIIRTYIEWLTDMPWQKRTRDSLDLKSARRVLDEDHFGLVKVKERILEFLAVRKLSKSTKGPILCLVGPPGVGKTSLGKSVARAMGRKFIRVSLGGVRDEAEIRGHRRTYIGALPGRIVQSLKRVGVKNPVFMLDEIDKMSMDFRGDPSSALLEVLDPEQNTSFSDHYLEVDFDLSEVFFITTANSEYEIPGPLHDRMEVVRLSGYTSFEKERIARLFLVPKQMKETGLTEREVHFSDGALKTVIQRYTREAGVRELERQVANLCRKVAHQVVTKRRTRRTVISDTKVVELLGPEMYSDIRTDKVPMPGVAVGLAWTWAGGDILNIETSTMKGKGTLMLTGQLGDVMKESAQAAYTYLRAHAKELEIPPLFFRNLDLHLHVPEGAIPKDGPSAGVALAVSMVSALRATPPAPMLAMTGEITLRGLVLPVGGIKEKVLAAHRAGIRTIVLPKENEKDLKDIPKEILADIKIILVTDVGEAFAVAFGKPDGSRKRARKPAGRKRASAK